MRLLLTENVGLKISALLIAFFLWFFVTSRGQSEMSMEVPVEFKNVPAGLGIMSSSHKAVVVNVKGQERLMKNIKPSNIRVMLDLAKARKGEGSYNINKDEIKLPYAMAVTTVSPSSVRVKMDETGLKTVKVKPVLVGEPEDGFVIKSVEVVPGSVAIQGLKSEIRKVRVLRTEPLEITGLNESAVQDLGLDAGGINITPEPATVKVTVLIAGRKK